MTSSFAELRDESDLLDATVVCEGQTVRAHKLVLSACSGVFRQLFRSSSSALAGGGGGGGAGGHGHMMNGGNTGGAGAGNGSMMGGILNDHSHPVILLWDVKADDLRLLFNFMYEGQVSTTCLGLFI